MKHRGELQETRQRFRFESLDWQSAAAAASAMLRPLVMGAVRRAVVKAKDQFDRKLLAGRAADFWRSTPHGPSKTTARG